MAESQIKSTRLRYISSESPDLLSLAITSMPVKVELKGTPMQDDEGRWFVWFVIPDHLPEFENVNL